MANRMWKPVETPRHGVRNISVRFFPNGTSTNPLSFSGSGVKSVVRTGSAGVFTVTFEDKWKGTQLCGFKALVQHTTAVDLVAQLGDFTDGTSAVDASVLVRLNAVATPTDMAANANNSVGLEFSFQNNPRAA